MTVLDGKARGGRLIAAKLAQVELVGERNQEYNNPSHSYFTNFIYHMLWFALSLSYAHLVNFKAL